MQQPSGYKWVFIDDNGLPRSTHQTLKDLNPQGRGLFQTKEEAEEAFSSWHKTNHSMDSSRFQLIDIF
jgi:hypothetical protein